MSEKNLRVPLTVEIKFPLPDGRVLVQGPLTYNSDGLATAHNCEFIEDERFVAAYEYGMQGGPIGRHLEWRVHVALWLASQAAQLDGDFIECGVHTGIMSGAIMTYLDFSEFTERTFYLLDTFAGIPEHQISPSERELGISSTNVKYQNGDSIYEAAKRKFSRWPNASIVRGTVPDSLCQVKSKQISFAHIDMNVAAPEIAAAEFIWPLLVPGAFLLIDDYGWMPHIHQKRAWDLFAKSVETSILALPTGQAVIMKGR